MQQAYRTAGLRMALDTVVVEASRLLSAGRRGLLSTEHPAVAKARNLMENHPGQPWRLSELGRMVGLSPNHLVTLFTRDVGVSPHRHLLRLRIDRAKHQLATTDAPVTSVAMELGFSSSQHFARSFRQLARMSARAWRARHQGRPPRPGRSTPRRAGS
jgi:transcriptional regulator GlxA family with amidase domain